MNITRRPDGITIEQVGFVPFSMYPALKTATDEQIASARLVGDQIVFDALDMDIDLRSLVDPDAFPLEWLERITDENRHDEIEWGSSTGNEFWWD